VHSLTRWKNRILDAIADGKVRGVGDRKNVCFSSGPFIFILYMFKMDGKEINLTIETGTDIIGNLIEASDNSINQNYYGSLHNNMHLFTSLAHDPDGRFLEDGGVMGNVATAMRDPVFYRVHGLVDNFYHKFKESLPPYTREEVIFCD
jgi:tyrosinase